MYGCALNKIDQIQNRFVCLFSLSCFYLIVRIIISFFFSNAACTCEFYPRDIEQRFGEVLTQSQLGHDVGVISGERFVKVDNADLFEYTYGSRTEERMCALKTDPIYDTEL